VEGVLNRVFSSSDYSFNLHAHSLVCILYLIIFITWSYEYKLRIFYAGPTQAQRPPTDRGLSSRSVGGLANSAFELLKRAVGETVDRPPTDRELRPRSVGGLCARVGPGHIN